MTSNSYQIDVGSLPSIKDMEQRSEIMAKLLIRYNKEQYKTKRQSSSDAKKFGAKNIQ